MKTLLGITALAIMIILLGCVNGNVNTNADVNANCVPGDVNKEALGIDENTPTCTSGSEWSGGLELPNTIPGIDNPGTINPDPSPEENSNQVVNDSACQSIQGGVGFANLIALADPSMEGASLEYKGVAEYRGQLWCKTIGSKPGEPEVTLYQNPFYDDTWFVSPPEKGHMAEMHVKNSMIVEICDNGVCHPFGYPST